MPREPLKVPFRLESLSILAPDGTFDPELEPRIPDADLLRLYRTMLASRRLDERCLQLQRQGRMGTYGPSKGQEAASLGAAYVLNREDWLVPSFRETAGLLWRGWPMRNIMLWWGGFESGNLIPDGLNDLPMCVPIASQCQYGMGLAWAAKLKAAGQVCLTFCGDGGTSEGDFHEAMNFAGVYNLPLIMFIQNNQWAISVPRHMQTRSATIAQKAIAYGFDGLQVDGNDILAVALATREAAEKARTGGGPTLIEAVTYRLSMHTTADDPKKYRCEDEVKQWECRDPLLRFRQYLRDKPVRESGQPPAERRAAAPRPPSRHLLDPETEQAIDADIAAELDAAVKDYLAAEVTPLEFFNHMYALKPPELERQEAELRHYLDRGGQAPREKQPAGPTTRAEPAITRAERAGTAATTDEPSTRGNSTPGGNGDVSAPERERGQKPERKRSATRTRSGTGDSAIRARAAARIPDRDSEH